MVGTSVILQMMRNRVFEVEDEYYLYLNKVEDKLIKCETVSISEWVHLFSESGLPEEEYDNFYKIWIESYVRYYFFRESLRDLPNTTDINTVRKIITVNDFAYPAILKLKLAYVYGNKISDYDSLVTKWLSNKYVLKWLDYRTYRKLDEYWDMEFVSGDSVFRSVLNYERKSIEDLDSIDYIPWFSKTIDDIKNLMRFTLYCYNDMISPRVSIDYIKKKYSEYCKGKDKDFLKYLNEILSFSTDTLNARSLRISLELAIVQKEIIGKDRLLIKDKVHIKDVLESLCKCLEVYTYRVIKDSYYLTDFTGDDVYVFRSDTGFSVKKRYLVYEMKHCKGFPAELSSYFARVDAEEFTENEFYKVANKLWEGYNLRLKGVWFDAVMRGFYIPVFMKEKLEQFCNTDELLMNFTVDDIVDRDEFHTFIYYYLTDTNNWNLVKNTIVKIILSNKFRGFWYAFAIVETGGVLLYSSLLNRSIIERVSLHKSLDVGNNVCNPYLVSNDGFSICSTKLDGQFKDVANFRLFLENRLYGDLIDIDDVRRLLQEYPDYILTSFNEIIGNELTKFSRESIDLLLDCSLDYYLKYVKEQDFSLTYLDMLNVKDEYLKSLTKKETSVSNSKAVDIFFGKK